MQDLGRICVSFVTQTVLTGAIITGIFDSRSLLDLGNKRSFLEKKERKGEVVRSLIFPSIPIS
jgi:hypothetical protein